MASTGQRGKWAEKQVNDALKNEAQASDFDFNRLPDARAGSFQPALADFDAIYKGTYFLLEVKEITTSATRLPYNSFATDKVSRMVKRQMAGAKCWVLICHKPEGRATDKCIWRLVPLAFFQTRDLAKPSGSWLLTDYNLMTLAEALSKIFGDTNG